MSWKTFFIVKSMTLYNYMTELYTTTTEKVKNLYSYLNNYYKGYHDIWLFIPGHTIPLSLNNLNNAVKVNWIYDNYDSSLIFGVNHNPDITNYDNLQLSSSKLTWLSSKIRIINSKNHVDYDIDTFIQKFRLRTVDNVVPSLYVLFMCWCTYTKYWFKRDDIIEFHIIDSMGEEFVLNLEKHNNSLSIKNNKIYTSVTEEDKTGSD
jgi:hypothetical protein